jgi:hypothetical protein
MLIPAMPPCDYCEWIFDDEEAYIEHPAERHYEELGWIDKHRVDSTPDTEKRWSLKTFALGG